MDTQKSIKEIIFQLKNLQDNQRKSLADRNFPGKLEILGVTSPNIKKVLKTVLEKTNTWSTDQKIELAIGLTQTHYHECHHLAYYYLEKEKEALKSLSVNDAEKLAACLDNWVLVDTYCTFILGVLWRIETIDDAYIHKLLNTDDLWKRRCAVVSTIALNQASRGGKGDTKRTIEVCKAVIDDHRPMIIKALSWALRVLIRRDKKAVEAFMRIYGPRIHNQVKREVKNKLKTGLKNP